MTSKNKARIYESGNEFLDFERVKDYIVSLFEFQAKNPYEAKQFRDKFE